MMPSIIRLAIPLLLGLGLAACTKDRTVAAAANIELAQLETLPQPARYHRYELSPMEELDVTVTGAELFSGRFVVGNAGSIGLPLIGDVNVAGLTPREAGRLIADRLRGDYVLDPQVQVSPRSIPAPAISIGGAVSTPGSYEAAKSPSLMWAINNAGGLSDVADRKDVLVFRTVEGQRYIGVYNIGAIQRGNYADPPLFPGDTVIVGDSPTLALLDRLGVLLPILSTSVIVIDRITR